MYIIVLINFLALSFYLSLSLRYLYF